jgi:enamine deaminase RidA (YjgF/YER057c/UK114 family)
MWNLTLLVLLGFALSGLPGRPQLKNGLDQQEEATQVREIPKEPPQVVVAETSRLEFRVSRLSAKGLLSQQVRDGLKSLFSQASGATIVRLRAFVAGSGDMRRVYTIVSETFTEKRLPLPVVTVVQAGSLPMTGVQVVMEATATARKPVNPHGLAFLSAESAASNGLPGRMAPLVEKSLAGLAGSLRAAGLAGEDVVWATCFLSSMDDIGEVRRAVASEFPRAAYDFVQPLRAPSQAVAACEAVARLRSPAVEPLRVLNAAGADQPRYFSRAALVSAPRVALAGSQLAFGYRDDDARLAFQRLGKVLGQAGSSLDRAAVTSIYPLSGSIGEQVRRIGPEFFDKARPPAGTLLPFEGLPSLDASFAVDILAVAGTSQ